MRPTIEELLDPVSLDEFLRDYWGKTSLYVRGHADKFREIMTFEQFQWALRQPRSPQSATVVRAMFPAAQREKAPILRILPTEAHLAYKAGGTVCVTNLQLVVPGLRDFCEDLRAAVGFPGLVGANGYWSADGHGFGPHFDARIATTFQIEGAKTWHYSDGAGVSWPDGSANYIDERMVYDWPDPEGNKRRQPWELEMDPRSVPPWRAVTLEPGDILCLPAGAWHAAEAKGHSFAINVYFEQYLVADFLGSLLDRHFHERADWRHVPPLLASGGLHGGPNARAESFVRERLDEAIAYLAALRDDPSKIFLEAGEMLSRPQAASEAKAEGWLRPSPSLIVVTKRSDEGCTVLVGGERIETKGKMALVLKAALQEKRFEGAALQVPGLERASITSALAKLIEAGVLVDATQGEE